MAESFQNFLFMGILYHTVFLHGLDTRGARPFSEEGGCEMPGLVSGACFVPVSVRASVLVCKGPHRDPIRPAVEIKRPHKDPIRPTVEIKWPDAVSVICHVLVFAPSS